MIDKFIFLHILKTAGTTIRHNIFEMNFKGKYVYDGMFKPRLSGFRGSNSPVIFENQPYPKGYKKRDIIFGHFKYDKYQHLNLPMFSFIRHPVDRMISQYYYHRKFYEKKGIDMNLIKFSKLWKNHMSYVLGDLEQYKYIGVVENLQESLNNMCDIIGIKQPNIIIPKRVAKYDKPGKKIRNKIANINSEDMELYENIITKS